MTNVTDLTPPEVVSRYKALADIERGFRVLKDEIEVGPIYHRSIRRLQRPQNRQTDLNERPAQPAVVERLNAELKHISHLRPSYVELECSSSQSVPKRTDVDARIRFPGQGEYRNQICSRGGSD